MATFTSTNQKKELADNAADIRRDSRELSHDIRDFAERAGTSMRDYLYTKSEQADRFRRETEDTIVAHPLKSVTLAAIGGLILGAILRRI
jgi:ElaB/YqjD/DUF883 family membrane-anchored ribosome-binding protein